MIEKHEIGAIMRGVSGVVRNYVAQSLASVIARIDDFESRLKAIPAGPKGEPGVDGKNVDPEEMRGLVLDAVSSIYKLSEEMRQASLAPLLKEIEALKEEIRTMPTPKDGRDIDPEIVRLAISGEVTRQVAEIPRPKDGVDAPAVDIELVRGMVDEMVIHAIAEIPKPKDGVDGKDLAPIPEVEFYEKVYGCVMRHLEQSGSGIGMAVRDIARREVAQIPVPKDGKDGADGKDGESIRGADGAPGRDADPVDIDKIVELAVSQIPKPMDGINGRDGVDGINGKDAPPVNMEIVRGVVIEEVRSIPIPKDGKDGLSIKGDTGERGVDGINGKDGNPGRDALQVDVLPAIDNTKSYPRGTFAIHDGGLIRSFRVTEPVGADIEKSGWEVVLNGIAGFTVRQDEDLRTFHVEIRTTSGKPETRSFNVPVVLDRGVFKDGNAYFRGDGTTWDGSFWICQDDTTIAKPGTSSAWRLSVKRGSAGKDFRPAPDKPTPGPIKL